MVLGKQIKTLKWGHQEKKKADLNLLEFGIYNQTRHLNTKENIWVFWNLTQGQFGLVLGFRSV